MLNKVFKTPNLNNGPISVLGLNKEVQAEYVWNLFCVLKKDLLVVTSSIYEANLLHKNLLYAHDNVYLYPMDDFLVSESLSVSPDLLSIRIDTLNSISTDNKPKIVITNLMGYLRFLPSKKDWKNSIIEIKKEERINREDLIKKLNSLGYEKSSVVTHTGEYSKKGYILDIFPYGNDNPIRIEFFDDEIESIREFDVDNQLSINKVSKVQVLPFTEFLNIKNVEDIPNRQSLLPRVVNNISSIKEYLNDPITTYIDLESIKVINSKLENDIVEFKESDVYDVKKYMYELSEQIPSKYINISELDNVLKGNTEVYKTITIEKFNSNFEKINIFITKMLLQNKKVLMYLEKHETISCLLNHLESKSVITTEDKLYDGIVNIINKKLYNGFIINDCVILTPNELFKRDVVTKYKNRYKMGTKIKDINKLQVGDFVVHFLHGVGKYLGIKTLSTNSLYKDYITVEYKDGDKLYVPVEKIEMLSKYSSKEGMVPRLNKLGGTEWYKQKQRVREKVKDIANKLLKTSAQRMLVPGYSFLEDDIEQMKFDSNFEYTETIDQEKAIQAIKKDMEKPHPMDRLLCGDVGYGKTEVAFRAIFKAIRSGKQTAFLCPTTILSKQHYENAVKRFDGFAVNIEVLNRFVTNTKKNEILKRLKEGKIDLIIGTHRILSKDVEFKDLGLLVVDEEQRFGVTHKERIKEISSSIDVLTLSATPIPRTLQMSLTGIRGLSLIETPPVDRYPVQTYVLRENDQIIKDAIYKELARDGQVFVLYNKVEDIEKQVVRIKKLVPESTITYIHGRMNKDQIERAMEAFTMKEFNVLVCTTIIETGIDIQNANTLIVLNADCFGLSQLYQIRGRIGRGSNIGYAYLMYEKNKELNEIATKRLSAIKEFTELGSGYSLAMRDLSIRGAGDILGKEQSGFIDSVGYDLYLKLLNEEVEKLKNNSNSKEEEDKIKEEKPFLQVSTHINDFYAESEDMKIEVHQLINTINSIETYESVKKELTDRFGELEENIIIYMNEELFQALSKEKGVVRVDQTDKNIIVHFNKHVSETIDGTDLLTKLFKITPNFNVEYKNKELIIALNLRDLKKHFIYYLIDMLKIFE